MGRDSKGGAAAQQRRQGQGNIAAVPHFMGRRAVQIRQALPTVIGIRGNSNPTAGGHLLQRAVIARGYGDLAISAGRGVFVPHLTQGGQHIARQFRCLVQQRRGKFRPDATLRKLWQGTQCTFGPQ